MVNTFLVLRAQRGSSRALWQTHKAVSSLILFILKMKKRGREEFPCSTLGPAILP